MSIVRDTIAQCAGGIGLDRNGLEGCHFRQLHCQGHPVIGRWGRALRGGEGTRAGGVAPAHAGRGAAYASLLHAYGFNCQGARGALPGVGNAGTPAHLVCADDDADGDGAQT